MQGLLKVRCAHPKPHAMENHVIENHVIENHVMRGIAVLFLHKKFLRICEKKVINCSRVYNITTR
jgi:hypothetical protein